MQTVLFHSTIYGPIHSRRLGMSLGINLMPNDGKICSFDCLYCEAGFNAQGPGKDGVPSRDAVKKQLRRKLTEMKEAGHIIAACQWFFHIHRLARMHRHDSISGMG